MRVGSNQLVWTWLRDYPKLPYAELYLLLIDIRARKKLAIDWQRRFMVNRVLKVLFQFNRNKNVLTAKNKMCRGKKGVVKMWFRVKEKEFQSVCYICSLQECRVFNFTPSLKFLLKARRVVSWESRLLDDLGNGEKFLCFFALVSSSAFLSCHFEHDVVEVKEAHNDFIESSICFSFWS